MLSHKPNALHDNKFVGISQSGAIVATECKQTTPLLRTSQQAWGAPARAPGFCSRCGDPAAAPGGWQSPPSAHAAARSACLQMAVTQNLVGTHQIARSTENASSHYLHICCCCQCHIALLTLYDLPRLQFHEAQSHAFPHCCMEHLTAQHMLVLSCRTLQMLITMHRTFSMCSCACCLGQAAYRKGSAVLSLPQQFACCACNKRLSSVTPLTIIPVVPPLLADQLPAAIPGSAVAVPPPLVCVGRGVGVRAAELRL